MNIYTIFLNNGKKNRNDPNRVKFIALRKICLLLCLRIERLPKTMIPNGA
jgi:hypothetical protein